MDIGTDTASGVESAIDKAADHARGFGDSLKNAADKAEGQADSYFDTRAVTNAVDKVKDAAEHAKENVTAAAENLWGDVVSALRKNPAQALLVTFGLGVIASRFLCSPKSE